MTVDAELLESCVLSAQAFRLGKEAEGSRLLRQCLDLLHDRYQAQLRLPECQALLAAALGSQQRHDWLGLADSLEYDLPAFFERQTDSS
jgi:hypothetical protein